MDRRKIIIVIIIIVTALISLIYFYKSSVVRNQYLSEYSEEYIANCKYYCNCQMHWGVCTDECKEVLNGLNIKYDLTRISCDEYFRFVDPK